MKTIKQTINKELIIKNSKFIAIIEPLNSIEDFENIMKDIKTTYKNATHYCYAYIINNIKHSNDDGEPNGTAGTPILNVLEKNNLTNIICIVIRYFGGIKLGAGGLIRAYTKSVTEALKMANISTINEGYRIKFSFTYENLKNINLLIDKAIMIKKEFSKLITYEIIIKKEQKDIINKLKLITENIIEIKEDYYFD